MGYHHSHFLIFKNQKKVSILKKKWLRSLILLLLLTVGLVLSIVRNKIFIIWLGLELKMFGVIPLLNFNVETKGNTIFLNNKEINVSFFYFLVQVIGRLFFAWGAILRDWYIIRRVGLIIKIGVPPFFFWVPPLISRLDWFSIGLLRRIQKIPGLILLRLIFDLDLGLCLLLSMLGLLISRIGIKVSYNNIKKLIGWSSVRKMSLLLALLVVKKNIGVFYYLFYRGIILIFCTILYMRELKKFKVSFLRGKKKRLVPFLSLLLLIFSGLPPFIKFLIKLYFLSGFYVLDKWAKIYTSYDKYGLMWVLYLIGCFLESWRIVYLFILLIILQAIGYIKAFIIINSGEGTRLNNLVSKINKKRKRVLIIFCTIYIFSLIVIWL